MPPCTRFPLVSAWWRQHELQGRVQSFRAARQPTPPRRALHRGACVISPSRAAAPPSLPSSCRACTSAEATVPSSSHATSSSAPVLLLISACLLGCPVTYRGTHVRLPPTLRPTPVLFLTEVLSAQLGLVQCVPVCPEVEWLGLPVPRLPLRLTRAAPKPVGVVPSALDNAAHTTLTEVKQHVERSEHAAPDIPARTLLTFDPEKDKLAPSMLATLPVPLHAIDGVVLKSRSPSCGVRDARLYAGGASAASRSATITQRSLESGVCDLQSRASPHGVNEGSGAASSAEAEAAVWQTSRGGSAVAEPYELVDGFFTALLRNSLHTPPELAPSACKGRRPPLPPPVIITSDRLLTHYSASDVTGSALPRDLSTRKTSAELDERRSAEHCCLDAFMECALQHREWRLSNTLSDQR